MKIPGLSGVFNFCRQMDLAFGCGAELHRMERNLDDNYGYESPEDAAYHQQLSRRVLTICDQLGLDSEYIRGLRSAVKAQDQVAEKRENQEAPHPVHHPAVA